MSKPEPCPITGAVPYVYKGYDPAKRKRCVSVYWRKGRRVRILSCPFGYQGKLGTISSIGERFVYIEIKTGKKVWDRDVVAYPPKCLRLV